MARVIVLKDRELQRTKCLDERLSYMSSGQMDGLHTFLSLIHWSWVLTPLINESMTYGKYGQSPYNV